MKKYLSILLALLLMLTLVACTERQVPEETIVETPSETEKETDAETDSEQPQDELEIPADGTYTGTAKGFSGDIEVEVVVEGGKITGVAVVKEDETPEIGGAAKDTVSQQIVDANSLNIDGVAGATVTTDGIKDAVKNALSGSGSAGGDDAGDEGFAIPEDGTYTGTAKGFSGDIEVEVVVAGGKISEVKVVKEDETPEIGGSAKETVSQQIVDAKSLEIDGVAGATITTDAIKDAVKNALSGSGSAGGDDAGDAGFTIPEDGTYTGTAKGFSSDIEVEVVIEGGKISSVKVLKEDETPEIGGAAKETVSQQIVDVNSLEIDGVAGATITTDGIKDAVKDALSQ